MPRVATIIGGANGMEPSGVKHTMASIASKIENLTRSKVFSRDEILSDMARDFPFRLSAAGTAGQVGAAQSRNTLKV
jgi:hypothetical protein